MNKLEQILKKDNGLYSHYAAKTKEYEYTPVCSITKAAELTASIAIEFSKWITTISFEQFFDIKEDLWVDDYGNMKSTQQLFEHFINKNYNKT